MSGTKAETSGSPVTREDLARLDYFEDLRDRYLSIESLDARWHPIDQADLTSDRDTCMRIHHLISLTRSVEETLDSAFRSGHVPGTAFFGRGNEAASVASAACLDDEEWLIPMHRNCGAHIAKGHPPVSIMAHFFGRAGGPSSGRDGNFHMGYRPRKITQLISHIGTMVPIAAGVAWAEKLRGQGRAALTYIGDGGTSAGKTQADVQGRQALLRVYRFLRRQPGLEGFHYTYVAPETGIRETYTIKGESCVTFEDYWTGRLWDDAICYSFYPIDVHRSSGDGIDIRRLSYGTLPTLPRGAMLPVGSSRFLLPNECQSCIMLS